MSVIENTWWPEKYRPKTIDDFVGNEDFVNKVKHWIDTQEVPNLILYSEKSGTGKTTCCKLLANALDADIMYINASDENSIDTVRDKITSFAKSVGFKKWKILILDEFSYFSPNAQSALLNIIESTSKSTRFFLTGNYIEKFLPAIVSRCTPFRIQSPPIKIVCSNIAKILKSEGISYDATTIVKVVNQFYPDQRSMLNYCQANSIGGELVFSSENITVNEYCSKILEVLKSNQNPKDKIASIRQVIADSKVRQFDDLFKFLFDNLEEFVPDGKRSGIILHIAEFQHKSSLVLDKEIQLIAMFVNILSELK